WGGGGWGGCLGWGRGRGGGVWWGGGVGVGGGVGGGGRGTAGGLWGRPRWPRLRGPPRPPLPPWPPPRAKASVETRVEIPIAATAAMATINFRDIGSLQGSSGEASASHPGIGRGARRKGSRARGRVSARPSQVIEFARG